MTVTEAPETVAQAGGSAQFPAIPGNAGHPLDEAPLPFWQSEPCPSWCVMTVPHEDEADYDDRLHMGAGHHIDLTLEEPNTFRAADGRLMECDPRHLVAGLWQHYRDRDPYLTLILDGGLDIDFTLTEAAGLAAVLADLTRQAGAAGEAPDRARPWWLDRPCPAWCTAAHKDADVTDDRFHAGDYRQLLLTMEGAEAAPEPGPGEVLPEAAVTLPYFGVRLEQGYREREARVIFAWRDEYTALTLAEAGELAAAVNDLLDSAR